VQWASTLAPVHVSKKKKKSKSWNNPSKQARVPYQQMEKPIQVRISRGGERKRSR
jgi:hypothetical protein